MKRTRRIFCIILLAGFLSVLSAAGAAENIPVLQDDADLFTEKQETLLTEQMAILSEYGMPMLWTTRESGNVMTLAERFFRKHAGTGSGVVFLIDMRSREIAIFSDGEMYRTITRSTARTITDNVYRYLSRGDYYAGTTEAFSEIIRKMRGQRIAEPMRIITSAIIALALAISTVYYLTVIRHIDQRQVKKGRFVGVIAPAALMGASAGAVRTTLIDRTVLSRSVSRSIDSDSGSSGRSSGGHSSGGGGHSSGGGGSHRF